MLGTKKNRHISHTNRFSGQSNQSLVFWRKKNTVSEFGIICTYNNECDPEYNLECKPGCESESESENEPVPEPGLFSAPFETLSEVTNIPANDLAEPISTTVPSLQEKVNAASVTLEKSISATTEAMADLATFAVGARDKLPVAVIAALASKLSKATGIMAGTTSGYVKSMVNKILNDIEARPKLHIFAAMSLATSVTASTKLVVELLRDPTENMTKKVNSALKSLFDNIDTADETLVKDIVAVVNVLVEKLSAASEAFTQLTTILVEPVAKHVNSVVKDLEERYYADLNAWYEQGNTGLCFEQAPIISDTLLKDLGSNVTALDKMFAYAAWCLAGRVRGAANFFGWADQRRCRGSVDGGF
ncbi:hypothetical protein LPJ57_006007 [Coemansia sp. RSA 486]|nr:hypothetical protein LPJ57_006007 [Coemansia sp. RSA 486]KAJ2236568.1 hypothetical protein IWW45_001696 [Coemansia sp. RSA 485]